MSKKVLIAMPAYNEAKVIEKVIKDIKKEGHNDILVIDDFSKDKTQEIAKKSGVKVLRHKKNRGAGAATKTAIKHARKNNYDFLVLIDSDGQHDPKEIKKLLEHSKSYDVIIGSRQIEFSKMPFQRKIANNIGSLVTWFFFGLYVKDSQSGFKVLNKNAINKIEITFERYEFSSEIIGEIKKHKLKHKEVPIQVIYTEHSLSKTKSGQSILNGFKMILRFMRKNRYWKL